MSEKPLGIRQSIAAAKSLTEIDLLLTRSITYKKMSDKTHRACKKTAKRRIKELADAKN